MANQRQRAKTASICTAETEESSHIFRISGYSHHIGLGVGRYISSTIFFVGGHGWRIRYFPEGEDREACEDFVAVYLDLVSVVATVRFKYNLKLVNKTTGESSSIFFSPNVLTAESPSSWGTNRFMKKSEIESTYMSDESVEIECDVTVIMESRLREIPIPSYFDFHVPPSNLSDDLHKLFESEEGVDITFKVKNEFFRAHKILLAIRSPVFKQQFYESLKVKRMESRTVDGMDPKVFKALLYFIYTDSLPTMSDLSEDEKRERIKKLFAVAHEYGMERMKLECGKILCDNLNVGNAFSTLALADEYKCQMLKDACIQFTIFSKRRMGDVLRSQGFEPFKETHSKVAVELWQSDSPDFFERRAFNIGLMNQDSSDEPRDNHRNSDSGREQRGALPVLHWLASSLPLIW